MFNPKHPPQNLEEIRALLAELPEVDQEAQAAVAQREPTLTKPAGSLGRLEDFSLWLAGWQATSRPRMSRPRVTVFAGSHGVVAQGVSAFPASVNQQMVENFINGGAAINQICKSVDAELRVMEVALEIPTNDFSHEPAMDDEGCAEAMAFGMSAIEKGLDLFVPGEMGIGNTTSAAAISHALYGGNAADWTGRGTGIDDTTLERKTRVVGDAIILHKNQMHDGLDVLRCVGGREIAAMAGAIIAARFARVPILLDGYVSCAAAAVLAAMRADALDHCLIGHVSAEPGHARLIEKLGKEALINFGMRLGEGSGAALAIPLLRAAAECHTGMATFEKAGIDGKEKV
ncbi:nicotinate-nucleotide--dimethylbenzimidazole phosphoribosyltransferase [Thalassospira indica]|uniref:Nicotinate-nucleotide--dimethylbenzimidazole phosphoribosyltransferase n=1 Tax=Thalassospira indica TaxID=1891279 RepID=A0ABM6XY97_9PROT|nr:nicotinate-nucleotide--dimethylbenzimidazole phosphoribosyltransferase [Thalassospira indica]AXO12963.1 nicotinate-nucleotide--dimethylbenzimidazole phosphoribosyltransferase [Thalassospira indica]OAZ15193.1 nicotinate-nucleotide--dimethylbenzimidazole phosphoribosyltransferase [Thalassospira profundimaris]